MSSSNAQLSNPFSTGSGGPNFENHIQAAFVVLMLTGGCIPCLEPWPIKKIKLQGKYAGYNTDDFIAFIGHRTDSREAKLLAQIKHSLSFTAGDPAFAQVICAAWTDFQNSQVFDQKTDALALITGPLSAPDIENVRTILEWARHSELAKEFVDKVNLVKFSSDTKRTKLEAFRSQLRAANSGNALSDDQLWEFLRRFHVLGYDLDLKSGVTLSLLNSHIAQFNHTDIFGIWAKIAKEVEFFNQNAGIITLETLSDEIKRAFFERLPVSTIPAELLVRPEMKSKPKQLEGDAAEAVMLASLVGSLNEKSEADLEVIKKHFFDR